MSIRTRGRDRAIAADPEPLRIANHRPVLSAWIGWFLVTAPGCAGLAEQGRYRDNARYAAELKERILLEALTRGVEKTWAGLYCSHIGDSVANYLYVSPAHGFVVEKASCGGPVYWCHGRIETQGEEYTLVPSDGQDLGMGAASGAFFAISWGRRSYLVPIEQMARFCSEVNAGIEPRKKGGIRWFMRAGDAERPVAGSPSVPARFEPWLLDQPLQANIVAVNRTWKFTPTLDREVPISILTLDAGEETGFRAGMCLYVPGTAPPTDGIIEIQRAAARSAIAVMRHFGSRPSPAVGTALSTRRQQDEATLYDYDIADMMEFCEEQYAHDFADIVEFREEKYRTVRVP